MFDPADPQHPYVSPRVDALDPRMGTDARPKHSGLGICSFVIAIGSGLMAVVIIAIAGVLETSTPGGMDEHSPEAMLVGLGILGVLAMSLLGIGLGIGGLVQSSRLRLWSILGLIFNAMVVLGIGGLMVLGLAVDA